MKFLRTAKVKIDALKLPGDWKRRLADPEVEQLAESFDTVPLLQRPGIRKDREIIWGRDRLAACYLRGAKTVDVDIWEATDEEIRLAEMTENARRRAVNRDVLVADLVSTVVKMRRRDEREAAEQSATNPMDSVDPWPVESAAGSEQVVTVAEPSKAEKSSARKAVAKLLGTTPAAVKQAEHRAEKAEESEVAPEAAPAEPGAAVKEALAEIDRLLVEAQKKLTRLTQAEPTLGERFNIQAAKSQISEAASVLRGSAPAGECLYCKLVPSEQPNCHPCVGSGWLTKAQLANVPNELRVTGAGASVYVRNELVRVSVLLKSGPAPIATPAPSKPHRGARKIKTVVVDAQGGETEVELPPVED